LTSLSRSYDSLKDENKPNKCNLERLGVVTMSVEHIAYNIKYFREKYNWTQQALADRLQVSRSVIAKWENNLVTPDIDSILKLSAILDVPLDHLIGTQSLRDDLLKDFKRIYRSQSKDFDEEVVELVEYLMVHPDFKNEMYRLKKLPLKKQQSIHQLFKTLIDQYERI